MYGWAGQILYVNLSTGTVEKKPLKPDWARAYLGGRGFNSRLLYDLFDPDVQDPFDPRNVICVSAGVLSGTLAPSTGRVTISVGRSPITGVFGDGNAGGHFGPEIKFAGYDSIVLLGRSPKPCYLYIENDLVEIRDAGHIWGKDTWETDALLREETHQPQAQVFAIGPAGERKVAIAVTLCNLTRAPGGGGNGAVMGSKNLKAIVIRGTQGVKVAKPLEFMAACEEAYDHLAAPPNLPVVVAVRDAGAAGGLQRRRGPAREELAGEHLRGLGAARRPDFRQAVQPQVQGVL